MLMVLQKRQKEVIRFLEQHGELSPVVTVSSTACLPTTQDKVSLTQAARVQTYVGCAALSL
jgi:hypothetical protein